MKQTTFIMFKPDAIERNLVKRILGIFQENGLKIERTKEIIVDEKLILTHYGEVIQKLNIPYFKDAVLTAFLGKKVFAYEISKDSDDIVHEVRELVGATDPTKAQPDSIRGKFGNDSLAKSIAEKRMLNNLIHASDSKESARDELKLWFGSK